jgi:hypothetical protein
VSRSSASGHEVSSILKQNRLFVDGSSVFVERTDEGMT